MTKSIPKFSIITPSFNQGKYIRDTIDSVQRQNYPNIEHIIVDGKSTDTTLEVIESYSHLLWISEPDEGQSDALNKGFSWATGDIIGWLNSDDWYADDIFHDVAKALEEYPIVIGACELRDKNNNRMYVVPNTPRTWFDMLKYWVPYSIPTQSSIFMRREILTECKRPDGLFVDKNLHYCMDYDLWLRISLKYPLLRRIDRVLSYYRMTDENKTGQVTEGMPYAEPEMSQIFNRYKNIAFTVQQPVSHIILEKEDSPAKLNNAINDSLASIIVISEKAYTRSQSIDVQIEKIFSRDQIGILLDQREEGFLFAARKIVLAEFDGFDESLNVAVGLHKILSAATNAGWEMQKGLK